MFKLAQTIAVSALVSMVGFVGWARPLAAAEGDAGKPPAVKAAGANVGLGGTSGKTGGAQPSGATTGTTKANAKATTKVGAGGKAAAGSTGPTPADDKDVASTPPPANSSPMAELKQSNEQLDKLLKKKYPNWSPEGEAQRAAVQKLVGGFLDYRELAHRALARHWDKLSPAQRKEFVSTLRQLVERSYLKQVSGDPNYNIKYEKEDKTGSEASVDATLTTMARGKKVKMALVYKLIYKNHWFVYDIVTDEQSMLENYRAEFNKIINKEGFDALLTRMKKKLDEKDE